MSEQAQQPRFQDLPNWATVSPAALVSAHLDKPRLTARSYAQDLDAFAAWTELDSRESAAIELLARGSAQAKRMLSSWVDDMLEDGLGPATIRRRVFSLKGLVRSAAERGIVQYTLTRLPNLPAVGGSRERLLSRATVERLFRAADSGDNNPKSARDVALLAMIYWHGLRAGEVLSIRRQDVQLPRIKIAGKRGPVELTLCRKAYKAVRAWLERRGDDEPGPLFRRCVGRGRAEAICAVALTAKGLTKVIRRIAHKAGTRCSPLGLRQSALAHLAALRLADAAKCQ